MADNTRWVSPKGAVRITKADGNLYIRDMLTNRVTVTQLSRLVDIRTDKGDTAVVIDTGHTLTGTLMHGYRFEAKEARNKFVDDLMEVLSGDTMYVEYPSIPKVIQIDLSAPEMTLSEAREVALEYLKKIIRYWRINWGSVNIGEVSLRDAINFVDDEERSGKWSTDLHKLIVAVEDIRHDSALTNIHRDERVVRALTLLESVQVHTKDFRVSQEPIDVA